MSDANRDREACFIRSHLGGADAVAPERPLFAWFHRSTSPVGAIVAVLCNPFGYEAICAHRSYRVLAESLAEAGVPALRFDYAGAGDSTPTESAPSIKGWIASTGRAIEAAKAYSGATKVVLIGVRAGATVAALTGMDRDDVAGVVEIAPVVSGKAYVRELRALQMALGLAPAPPQHPAPPEGGQEACGFYLSAEGKAALSEADLVKAPRAPAPRVLVVDRHDFPPSEKLLAHLRSLGAEVDHAQLQGYPEMMLDPHKVIVPRAILRATTEWVARVAREVGGTPGAGVKPETSAEIAPGVVDRAVHAGRLFGILSAPSGARRSGRAILFLNAGSTHRVGPNELFARLARECVARGDVALRVDVSGIGDSPPRPGEPENEAYSPRAQEDIDESVAWLRDHEGLSDVQMIGLCSGAYHGFNAAAAGSKLRRAILINPLVFFYTAGMNLDLKPHTVAAEAKRYGESMFRLESWKKLLRGDVKVRVVAEILGRRALGIARERGREALRRFDVPLEKDVATELERARKNQVHVAFVFAKSDPGHGMLLAEGGRSLARLEHKRAISIDVFDGADHTFTPVWSHAPLLDRLRELTGSIEPAG